MRRRPKPTELSVQGFKVPILERTDNAANVGPKINASTRKKTTPNEDDQLQKTMVLVISPKRTNPVFDALSVSVTQGTSAFSAGRNSPQSPIPIPALYMSFSEHSLIKKFEYSSRFLSKNTLSTLKAISAKHPTINFIISIPTIKTRSERFAIEAFKKEVSALHQMSSKLTDQMNTMSTNSNRARINYIVAGELQANNFAHSSKPLKTTFNGLHIFSRHMGSAKQGEAITINDFINNQENMNNLENDISHIYLRCQHTTNKTTNPSLNEQYKTKGKEWAKAALADVVFPHTITHWKKLLTDSTESSQHVMALLFTTDFPSYIEKARAIEGINQHTLLKNKNEFDLERNAFWTSLFQTAQQYLGRDRSITNETVIKSLAYLIQESGPLIAAQGIFCYPDSGKSSPLFQHTLTNSLLRPRKKAVPIDHTKTNATGKTQQKIDLTTLYLYLVYTLSIDSKKAKHVAQFLASSISASCGSKESKSSPLEKQNKLLRSLMEESLSPVSEREEEAHTPSVFEVIKGLRYNKSKGISKALHQRIIEDITPHSAYSQFTARTHPAFFLKTPKPKAQSIEKQFKDLQAQHNKLLMISTKNFELASRLRQRMSEHTMGFNDLIPYNSKDKIKTIQHGESKCDSQKFDRSLQTCRSKSMPDLSKTIPNVSRTLVN